METLGGREDQHLLSSDRIRALLLVLKVSTLGLNLGDTTYTPSHAKVNFLMLPVFNEDDTPQTADNGINGRESAQEKPGSRAESGGEDEEGEIRLSKGKVESNLLAQSVPDLVKILGLQKVFLGPSRDPLLVVGVVVQGEDGLDIFPLSILGSDASSTFFFGVGDHAVDDTVAFGFVKGFVFDGLLGLLGRCGCSDPVDPVLDS